MQGTSATGVSRTLFHTHAYRCTSNWRRRNPLDPSQQLTAGCTGCAAFVPAAIAPMKCWFCWWRKPSMHRNVAHTAHTTIALISCIGLQMALALCCDLRCQLVCHNSVVLLTPWLGSYISSGQLPLCWAVTPRLGRWCPTEMHFRKSSHLPPSTFTNKNF